MFDFASRFPQKIEKNFTKKKSGPSLPPLGVKKSFPSFPGALGSLGMGQNLRPKFRSAYD
jgi:hypothetical protein